MQHIKACLLISMQNTKKTAIPFRVVKVVTMRGLLMVSKITVIFRVVSQRMVYPETWRVQSAKVAKMNQIWLWAIVPTSSFWFIATMFEPSNSFERSSIHRRLQQWVFGDLNCLLSTDLILLLQKSFEIADKQEGPKNISGRLKEIFCDLGCSGYHSSGEVAISH